MRDLVTEREAGPYAMHAGRANQRDRRDPQVIIIIKEVPLYSYYSPL